MKNGPVVDALVQLSGGSYNIQPLLLLLEAPDDTAAGLLFLLPTSQQLDARFVVQRHVATSCLDHRVLFSCFHCAVRIFVLGIFVNKQDNLSSFFLSSLSLERDRKKFRVAHPKKPDSPVALKIIKIYIYIVTGLLFT